MADVRVARSATAERGNGDRESRLLAEWRELDAYVLLGDPGAGKTWAFEDECTAVGGVLLSARNVVSGIAPSDLAHRTVFIDGLDEVRAGTSNGRVPFDAIRKWLHDRGRPRFRLSCREAEWLGANDKARLAEVAPGAVLGVLHLDALTQANIESILAGRARDVPDVNQFLRHCERAGISELLRNPLLLDLVVKATTRDGWPETRAAIYHAACEQLAAEVNDEHLVTRSALQDLTAPLLNDAGLLFAVLLLSDKRGIALRGAAGPDDLALADLSALVALMNDQAAALRSKLFTVDAALATPRHRSIAEFLAAKALAQRIQSGLPLGRVLALMQGFDGKPVEPLRGLWAWLAVHHMPGRQRLMAQDPLGFVLNADAAELSTAERAGVLAALRDAAEADPWFRNAAWASHPFAPLATADMAPVYEALLRDQARERDPGRNAFIGVVFDALRHGQPMPSLAPDLETWVGDGRAASHLRVLAYRAWKSCVGFEPMKAQVWLDAIQAGALQDADDQLTGELLCDLYPAHVGPGGVFAYLHPARQRNLIGTYDYFWSDALLRRTPDRDMPELAEGWLNHVSANARRDVDGFDIARLRSRLLAAALLRAGDQVSDAQLYRWLGIGLDEYGTSRLDDEQANTIRPWLAGRPERMKAVIALGHAATQRDEQGHLAYWQAEQRLHHAPLPRDWHHWLLAQAAKAATSELAEYCLFPAALAALEPGAEFDRVTLEQVESWVEEHKAHWPQAPGWLEKAWFMELDHWRGQEHRRRLQRESQHFAAQAERKQALLPHIESLHNGSAPPGLLYQVAMAHEHGFSDLAGDTPLKRVRSLLVSDEATAQAVIDALPQVLARKDLPTADDAIALEAKGKQHHLRLAALLAARLAFEHDAGVAASWRKELAQRLVAYYYTDGTGNMPGWYRWLAQHKPTWLAPVLLAYVLARFKRKAMQAITGLWALGSEADHAALARLALPRLLEAFPLRANEAALGTLNRSLLPAMATLDDAKAATIVRRKLRQTGLSAAQRLAWLVADLPYRSKAVEDLAALVGHNERRAVVLGTALHEQGTLSRVMQRLKPHSVQRLIEVLGPITPRDSWQRDGIVTVANHRGDTVRALFAELASNPSAEARAALVNLEKAPGLAAWGDTLQYSLRTQQATAREAGFKAASPQQVADVLANQAPANSADLKALAVQHLQDMLAAWRHVDTFALKAFWCDKGLASQPENECRNLLLGRLRERLATLGILVTPERTTAQDKRADLCVEFVRDAQRVALPIEIKKADNRQLWTAWRDQLQRQYAKDPDADGQGLYLVLWFGQKAATHPEGAIARNAEHLQALLEQRIPALSRSRISTLVVDLSWPVQ